MSENEKRRLNDMICMQHIVWTHLCGFDILDILKNINGFILLLFHCFTHDQWYLWRVLLSFFNSTAASYLDKVPWAMPVPWTPRKVIAEDAWASAARTLHMFLSWLPLRLSYEEIWKKASPPEVRQMATCYGAKAACLQNNKRHLVFISIRLKCMYLCIYIYILFIYLHIFWEIT